MDAMKRKKEFKEAVFKPMQIKDSRFGLRKLFQNTNESPSIATYRQPGKGVSGEHLN